MMRVERPKKAAPAKKTESCLRERERRVWDAVGGSEGEGE